MIKLINDPLFQYLDVKLHNPSIVLKGESDFKTFIKLDLENIIVNSD